MRIKKIGYVMYVYNGVSFSIRKIRRGDYAIEVWLPAGVGYAIPHDGFISATSMRKAKIAAKEYIDAHRRKAKIAAKEYINAH